MPEDATAGAVGIVRREHDHLVAVANWDCRAIDFYVSNGQPLHDAACRFARKSRWTAEAAATDDWQPNRTRGQYQAINLLADESGRIYMLGFDTPAGLDVVDLFRVDLGAAARGHAAESRPQTDATDGRQSLSQCRRSDGAKRSAVAAVERAERQE